MMIQKILTPIVSSRTSQIWMRAMKRVNLMILMNLLRSFPRSRLRLKRLRR